MIRRAVATLEQPMVIDADALNALAGSDWSGGGKLRVLTPHPGEMARLTGKKIPEIQADRVTTARDFATARKVCLVLKGERTLIAFPDGRVWINPTGSPAMATGGTGDILTGLVAGFLGQFPKDARHAIVAAVYLHGRSGQLGALKWGEEAMLATDLLDFLPAAMEESPSCGLRHARRGDYGVGRGLARELPRRGVVLLIGNLGAGKTTLTKGIAEGRGVARAEDVSSPTFTLIHEYGAPVAVYHVDFYRLDSAWNRPPWVLTSCSIATHWCSSSGATDFPN